jgi:DNA-binding ferritin-like protein
MIDVLMSDYAYLTTQAAEARRLAANTDDPEVRAVLVEYAASCDRQRLTMEQHDRVAREERRPTG